MKVYNLEEAKEFFINNSKGFCLCVKGNENKECKSYPEAIEFFNNQSI